MISLLIGFCAAAASYQVLAIVAAIIFLRRRDPKPTVFPPVSILKPVHGRDERFYDTIRSHAVIDYPEFEILFGVRNPDDDAVAEIERLRAEFPQVQIRVIHSTTQAPNGKAGVLRDLAAAARHPVLVVNDSDILVAPDYLRKVVAPLENTRIGLVTCLYRATAGSAPAQWEALGISTDFAPSALVAPFVGVKEFGLGSTLVFREEDLRGIGGFEAIGPYIADDYQLGKRISQLGKEVWLSKTVVQTYLGSGTWRDVWLHQLRWARTIRLSRGAYLGLPIANASLWAAAALAAGLLWWSLALLLLRVVSGWICARWVLHDSQSLWQMPLRDLWGFAVWCRALTGNTVVWRNQRLRLDGKGRIIPVE